MTSYESSPHKSAKKFMIHSNHVSTRFTNLL